MAFCAERRGIRCAASVLRDPLQSGSDSGGRGGPHQEHRIDAIQAFIQGLGKSEISAHHLNLWRQSEPRPGCARARGLRARGRQLRDNLAADGAGGADDEDTIHASTILTAVAIQ